MISDISMALVDMGRCLKIYFHIIVHLLFERIKTTCTSMEYGITKHLPVDMKMLWKIIASRFSFISLPELLKVNFDCLHVVTKFQSILCGQRCQEECNQQ